MGRMRKKAKDGPAVRASEVEWLREDIEVSSRRTDQATRMGQHNPPHPGEMLAGLWMEPLDLSVTAVAEALGVSRKTVSKIVNGGGAVTPEMALRLELAFGASAESWLGHQAAFDLWQIQQQRRQLAREVQPLGREAA